MRKCVFLFVLLAAVHLAAQGQDSTDTQPFVKKDFLILLSTKSYEAALKTARSAASSLNLKLDLRGLKENKESGLTLSKEECLKYEVDYPGYYACGRWDDGAYVSIEYSDAYSGFTKGYYIVIAAGGDREEAEIQAAYKKAKLTYKDAYFKSTEVYLGCMH